jgi:hypothetical protein
MPSVLHSGPGGEQGKGDIPKDQSIAKLQLHDSSFSNGVNVTVS